MEDQLRRGIALAREGKKAEARQMLAQVVRNDPRSALGWLWLAGAVETKEQKCFCLEKALQLNPQDEVARQALARIKSEAARPAPQVPISSQYFVGRPLNPENADELTKVLTGVFGHLGYAPCEAAPGVEGPSLLLNVCQEIFATRFGVFDLSSRNSNVYLELGIALGLNRPVVVVAREKTPLPPALAGHNVVTYADASDLGVKLARLCERGFPPAAQSVPDYCYFCGRACGGMSTPPDENMYLVLHESKLLWRALMQSLTPHLAGYHLYPVYLVERVSGPALCDVRRKVLAAQFALCHLGALSSESSFLALGMAIGSRAPWILLAEKGRGPVPADLRGVERIEYTTLSDLEGRLTGALGSFLGRIMSGLVARNDKTTLLSLPFWVQFEDWMNHTARPTQAPEAIQGRLQVVQYEGQAYLAKHVVPGRGLLVGRDSGCDVAVENPGVSSQHLRVLKGRNEKYFVEDLNSKNGTFLNGTRLSPGQKVELSLNDALRIPGARFLIWDDRPLPREQMAQVPDNTALLTPIMKIEIPDVSPPPYLDTWDHSIVLTVRLPGDDYRATFEVQAYYPMGRIVAELVDLLDLPRRRYRFRYQDRIVSDDETPLSIGLRSGSVLSIVPEGS